MSNAAKFEVPDSGDNGKSYVYNSGSDSHVLTDMATQAELDAHASDSTSVHGIADTSALLDTADIGVSVQAYSAVLAATTASFTTADETKLDGIEALADVTDETNVVAALSGATLTDLGTPASGDKILLLDASDSDNLKVAQFSTFGGGGGIQYPPFVNTTTQLAYCTPGIVRVGFADPIITLASGTTYYFGFFTLQSDFAVDAIQIKVQAVTGTANVRVAFIPVSSSTLQPTSLGYAVAAQAYSTTGEKTVTFASQTLAAGIYVVGVRTDNSTLALTGIRGQMFSGWRGFEQGFGNFAYLTVSEAYGAFASTPTAWTTVISQSSSGVAGVTIPVFWRNAT